MVDGRRVCVCDGHRYLHVTTHTLRLTASVACRLFVGTCSLIAFLLQKNREEMVREGGGMTGELLPFHLQHTLAACFGVGLYRRRRVLDGVGNGGALLRSTH